MTRKNDDETILAMLDEGKKQKEIAEHFGVSPAAICKLVKRIVPPEVPESFKALTVPQQKFVLGIAEGKTRTQAAADSFEVTSKASAKSIGYQAMKKPAIQVAVAELMQEQGLDRRYRVDKLKQHIDNRDPNVSLKALDQSWKLDGAYTENHNHNFKISIHEIEQSLAELEAEEAEIIRELELDD
jgi:hypothetical protein